MFSSSAGSREKRRSSQVSRSEVRNLRCHLRREREMDPQPRQCNFNEEEETQKREDLRRCSSPCNDSFQYGEL